jgi:hypothetical protein
MKAEASIAINIFVTFILSLFIG